MAATLKERKKIPSNAFLIFLVIGLMTLAFSPMLSITSATANNALSENTIQPTSTSNTIDTVYYASSKSDVYHVAGCRYISQIKQGNLITFKSTQEAKAAGYRPCSVCIGATPEPTPTLALTPTIGFSPLKVEFTATNTGSLISFTWDYGDGTNYTIQDMSQINTSHIYQSGIYHPQVRYDYINDQNDRISVNYFADLIEVYPTANFSASPTSGNVPLKVEFKDTSVDSPISWSWNFGDGTSSQEQNPVHTYFAVGDYNVTITVKYGSDITAKYGSDSIEGETHRYIVVNSPTTSKTCAYIANDLDNTISVIDISTNNVIATVKVGSGPIGVAVSPDGNKIFVTNGRSNTVSIIDKATNKVITSVKVGSSPNGIAASPDGKKVFVTNYRGNTVSVIDTETNIVKTNIKVGNGPFGVAVSPDGNKAYVTCDNNHTVYVIDTATSKVTATVNVENKSPGGVAVSPDGTNVYVANGNNNTVSVIDTATNIVTSTVNVDNNPHGIAVSPDGTDVYVANFKSNTVSAIDTSTKSVKATIPVGSGPYGIAVNPDGTEVYVTNDHDNTVSVINTATNTVTATVKVGKQPKSLGQFIGRKSVSSDDSSENGQSPSSSSDSSSSSSDSSSGGSSDSSSGGSSSSSGGSSSSSGGSSGSSSGGGGAGGSPEPQSNVEAKELSQTFIGSGSSVKFDFTQKVTPVVSVSFDSKKTAGKTTTIVEMLKGKSTLVSELPSDEVYKSVNVWVGNGGFGDSNYIENAAINFKVDKSWINNKNIDKSSITLNRYSDSKWNQLPTSLSGEDNTYLYFTAKTPGFSPFVITGKTAASEAVTETQSKPNIGSLESNASNATNEQTKSPSTKTPGFESICGILSLLAIFLHKRK